MLIMVVKGMMWYDSLNTLITRLQFNFFANEAADFAFVFFLYYCSSHLRQCGVFCIVVGVVPHLFPPSSFVPLLVWQQCKRRRWIAARSCSLVAAGRKSQVPLQLQTAAGA